MNELINKTDSFFSSSSVSSSSLPSLSVLSGEVLNDFNRLHNGSKGVFNRLYRAVFNWLIPHSKLDSFNLVYSIIFILPSFSPEITLVDFLMLCRIYYLSGGGVNVIDTRNVNFNVSDKRKLNHLLKFGFISRSSFVPSSPYLLENRCMQKVFISLNMQGIAFYNKVISAVYVYAKKDLYTMVGNEENKKARFRKNRAKQLANATF
jgi:hypothetical protein